MAEMNIVRSQSRVVGGEEGGEKREKAEGWRDVEETETVWGDVGERVEMGG